VDQAHATGVRGPAGCGIAVRDGVAQHLAAVVRTGGKALASAGAFVCARPLLKEHLINHARTLIFPTAIPPCMAEQIGAASRLVRPPIVGHGSARLRFSLTSGISDDELVRLESSLNNWREQESWSAAVARA